MHKKTLEIVEEAWRVLNEYHPMTIRQVFYQLVSRQVILNNQSQYTSLGNTLGNARKQGLIPWEWIEDRTRVPHHVSMWPDLGNFFSDVKKSYRRNVWDNQPQYVEVWVEKDALSGVFLDITQAYGVTLQVCRGYPSLTVKWEAAARFREGISKLLYFGDFDPSGVDIPKNLKSTFEDFESRPEIDVIALTLDQIRQYSIPPIMSKKTDKRRAAFVAEHGDVAAELDALPLPVLQEMIKTSIEASMDLEALAETREEELEDRDVLEALLRLV
ncbi:MAG: hypothetical protein KKA41_17895 [Proteobacteria bacterium]|nr:hypothetical protein [Pseudomonadota bacterium]